MSLTTISVEINPATTAERKKADVPKKSSCVEEEQKLKPLNRMSLDIVEYSINEKPPTAVESTVSITRVRKFIF
ncbi:hypothetical protein M3P19_04180 [Muricauda sp. 2012CJ35-5]|uniref:Uncharacterized protein n=1 Tax=Flagellimonas spongiicola TaxID=2942208 RepID=A0ABT0PQE4_9FLAO|nr:hypothetical protein [Allomuricauda spongiicola]MCL6273191.1 hypothetical protein [Allomuricauda spongiicola]